MCDGYSHVQWQVGTPFVPGEPPLVDGMMVLEKTAIAIKSPQHLEKPEPPEKEKGQ